MFDLHELKDKVAVIGVGNTRYGNFPETDDYGLAAQAFRNAVDDCGIDKNRIDGLLVSRIPYYARMGEILGLNPRWTITLPAHGRMSGMGIIEAATAIAALDAPCPQQGQRTSLHRSCRSSVPGAQVPSTCRWLVIRLPACRRLWSPCSQPERSKA